ncbi:MAG: DUF2459 domain-containing protein [Rhodobacteraceae bacterium]|jgi:uncharacterized protein (TIGR02117 family)|nr:DUF2459 domain-containing protein [Paracoccaceae bacterium]
MKKAFFIAIGSIVSTLLIYAFAAIVGAIIPNGETGGGKGKIDVHLVSGPIHYDVLLPATPQTRQTFAFLEQAGVPINLSGVEWILVGWGAKGFYIETKEFSDMKASTVAQAVIGDDAVMHFAAVGNIDGIETERLRLTSAEYDTLVSQLLGSLQSYDAIPNAGYTTSDAFLRQGTFQYFQNMQCLACSCVEGKRNSVWGLDTYSSVCFFITFNVSG